MPRETKSIFRNKYSKDSGMRNLYYYTHSDDIDARDDCNLNIRRIYYKRYPENLLNLKFLRNFFNEDDKEIEEVTDEMVIRLHQMVFDGFFDKEVPENIKNAVIDYVESEFTELREDNFCTVYKKIEEYYLLL